MKLTSTFTSNKTLNNNKFKQTSLLLLLSFYIGFSFMPLTVRAAGTPNNPVVINITSDPSPGLNDGYTFASSIVTITENGYYEITGNASSSARRIAINSGLNNVNIYLNDATIVPTGTNCAFAINSASAVYLTLVGNNTLTSGIGYAGLYVHETAELTIYGPGKLTSTGGVSNNTNGGGAGIGGNGISGAQNSGAIIIYGGEINAYGGNAVTSNAGGGAGIGGGGGRNASGGAASGVIIIYGGIINAIGGDGGGGSGGGGAAGIGGGGAGQQSNDGGSVDESAGIFIYGGIVYAKGGDANSGCGGAGVGGGGAQNDLGGGDGNTIFVGDDANVIFEGGTSYSTPPCSGPPTGNGGQSGNTEQHYITITKQPVNITVTENFIVGSTIDIQAKIEPSGGVYYQWYEQTTSGDVLVVGATSNIFQIPELLTEGVYYFYCIVSHNNNNFIPVQYLASPEISDIVTVTVEQANKSIDLLIESQPLMFETRTEGYRIAPSLQITVVNTGNFPFTQYYNTQLTVAFSNEEMNGASFGNFISTPTPTLNDLVVNHSTTFTLTTITGLLEGIYTATVTVSDGVISGINESFDVQFIVVDKEAQFIVVTQQPLKLNYIETENLDLTGLEVKLTYYPDEYNIITDEYVPLSNFVSKNITTIPSNNSTLNSSHNGTPVNVRYSQYVQANTNNLTVIPPSFQIDYSVDGINGDIEAEVESIPIVSGALVAAGKIVDFTAIPDPNYRVKVWKLNNIPVENNTTNNYSLLVSAYAEITVEFELITYQVTVTSAGSGASGSGEYLPGATVNISAGTPPTGYQFDYWTSDIPVIFADENSSSTSFTMPATAIEVTAHFNAIPYNITVVVLPNEADGSAEATDGSNPISTATIGTEVTVTASEVSNTGWHFIEWTIDNVSVLFDDENALTTTFDMPAANVEVTANFGLWEISISPSQNKDFGIEIEDYLPISAHTVTIDNTGDQPTGTITVALSGADSTSFSLSNTSLATIAVNGNRTFTVVPNTGLTVGTYSATVTVSGDKFTSKSFDVTFEVIDKTWEIETDANSGIDFGTETYGYAPLTPQTVTVFNTGNQPTGALTIALSGTNATDFTLSETSFTNILVGDDDYFTVVPNSDLSVGIYSATVTISGSNGINASFGASFEVEPAIPTIALLDYDLTPVTYQFGVQQSVAVTPKVGVSGLGTISVFYEGTSGTSYTKTTTAPINVGNYAITVDIAAGTNYEAVSNIYIGIFVINKATISGVNYPLDVPTNHPDNYVVNLQSLLPSDGGITGIVYNPAITLNTDGVIDELAFSYTAGDNLTIPVLSVSQDGKIAIITVTISSDNYNNFTSTITLTTVNKTLVIITADILSQFTYNAQPQGFDSGSLLIIDTDSNTPIDIVLDILYKSTDGKGYESSVAPTNAGEYELILSVPNSNPLYTGNAVYYFEILKASQIITVLPLTRTFGDGGFDLTGYAVATGSVPGDLSYNSGTITYNVLSEGNEAGAAITSGYSLSYTSEGVANISVTAAGSENYLSKTETFLLTVNPKTIDIENIIGVTPPVAGEIPVTQITETEQYTGTITWSPNDNPFDYNTIYTATITLTAKQNYTLQGVPANFFEVSGATSVTNSANSGIITAVFPKTEEISIFYSITISANNFLWGGYEIQIGANHYIMNGPTTIDQPLGTPVIITAIPNEPDYNFGFWQKNYNAGFDFINQVEFSFIVEEDVEFIVNFVPASSIDPILTLLVEPSDAGITTGSGTYSAGSNVNISVTPNANYEFDGWYDGNILITNALNHSFKMPGLNLTYTAKFIGENKNITADVLPVGVGTVTGTGQYSYGTVATLNAIPTNLDYKFTKWTENSQTIDEAGTEYQFIVTGDRHLTANFVMNTHTITATVGAGNGFITPSGIINVENGDNRTFTITPDEGYIIDEVLIDGLNNIQAVSTGTYTFENVISDHTIEVIFEINNYSVTLSVNPVGVGIVSGEGTNIPHGTLITVNAAPLTNFDFVNWTENGTIVSTNASYSFNIFANRELVANFVPKTFTITTIANPTEGGSLTGAGDYAFGMPITVTATPAIGYAFVNWTEGENIVSTNVSYSFSAISNRELTANFEIKTYTVTTLSNPTGGGIFTGAGTYSHGASVTVTATPEDGYTFENWTENGNIISIDESFTFDIEEDREFVANFDINTYTISIRAANFDPYGLYCDGSVEFGEGNYVPYQNGLFLCVDVPYGTLVTIRAINNGFGCPFYSWSHLPSYTIFSLYAEYTFAADDNYTLAAEFWGDQVPGWLPLFIIVDPEGAGSVTGDERPYHDGETAYLTATPFENYEFVGWYLQTQGELIFITTSQNFSFTMSPLTENWVAKFQGKLKTITTNVNPPGSGTVTGGGQHRFGTEITLTAIPNEGYIFDRWTENGATIQGETTTEYTFTVESDRNITAHFIQLSNSIVATVLSGSGTITPSGIVVVPQGNNQTFTIIPNVGWKISQVLINGINNEYAVASGNYTFENVAENQTIAVSFETLFDGYIITTTANPTDGGILTGAGIYLPGESVTVSALTSANYTFINWTEDESIVSTNANFTFNALADRDLVANFIPKTYTITATANPNDAGTFTGAGTYLHGETVTLTAVAEAGYFFVNWTENGNVVSTETSYTFNALEDRDLVANFTITTYTIAIRAATYPKTGTVEYGEGNYVPYSSGDDLLIDVPHGTVVTIKATPDDDAVFYGWSCLPYDPYPGQYFSTSTQLSFIAEQDLIDTNRIVAWFSDPVPHIPEWVYLTVEPAGTGVVTGGGLYQAGNNVTITATPLDNYEFDGWYQQMTDWMPEYLISNSPIYTFIMPWSVVRNTAKFQGVYKTISTHVNPVGSGTVTGGGQHRFGSEVKLTATPNIEYTFDRWTENGITVAGATSAVYQFIVESDRNLTAEFIPIPPTRTITISSNNYDWGTVEFGGGDYVPYQNGNAVSVDVPHGTLVAIKAIDIDDYDNIYFSKWTNDQSGDTFVSQAEYSFFAEENLNLTAVFDYQSIVGFPLALLVEPAGTGTAIINGGLSTIPAGLNVEIIATPFANYEFDGWYEGDILISNSANFSFTMPAKELTLTAKFTFEQFNIIAIVNPAGTGSVAGAGQYEYGIVATLVAIPNIANGYEFERWTENDVTIQGAEEVYQFTVTIDRTLTAHFVRKYNINLTSSPEEGGILTGGGIYQHASQVIVNATAKPGYEFVNWTENGNIVSTNANFSFIANGHRNLTANFIEKICNIIISVQNTSLGTVEFVGIEGIPITLPNGAGMYIDVPYGTEVTIKAIAIDPNYMFGLWTWHDYPDYGIFSQEDVTTFIAEKDWNISASFSIPPNYQLPVHLEIMPAGTGSVSGAGSYWSGETVNISATPFENYEFDGWYVGEGPLFDETFRLITKNPTHSFTMPAVYVRYYAFFQPVLKNIITDVYPQEGGTVTGGGQHRYGTEITLTATPNSADGYSFNRWIENGETVQNAGAIYTFTVENDRVLLAEFTQNGYIIVASTSDGNGTITPNGTVVVPFGNNQTFNFSPNEGYQITQVLIDGINNIDAVISGTYTFENVTENHTITVSFDVLTHLNTFNITIASFNDNFGTVEFVEGNGINVPQGASVTIKAIPNQPDHHFAYWLKNSATDVDYISQLEYTFIVEEDLDFVAIFFLQPIIEYTLTLLVDPVGTGTTTGSGTYQSGSEVNISATPSTNYDFEGWYEGNILLSGTANYSFNMPAIDITYTAKFHGEYKDIIVDINPDGGGTILGAGQHRYGTVATLKAIPNAGYEFVKWTENNVEIGTLDEISFTVLDDRTLTAEFIKTYTITIAANNNTFGTVEFVGGDGIDIPHGTPVTIKATPNIATHKFINWVRSSNGAVFTNQEQHTFNAEEDLDLIANFTPIDMYWLTLVVEPDQTGSVTGGGAYNANDIVNIDATPFAHFQFDGWYEGNTLIDNNEMYSFSMPTNDLVYIAKFQDELININSDVTPIGSGTVTGDGQHIYGTEITLTAIANPGYQFIRWLENSVEVSTLPELTFTVTNDRNLTAEFMQITYTVIIAANNDNYGTVEFTEGGNGTNIPLGTSVTVKATPNETDGYIFDRWTENGATVHGAGDIYQFPVYDNRILLAEFINNQPIFYTVDFEVINGHGTITASVDGNQIISGDLVEENKNILFTATPETGYIVKEWTINDIIINNHTELTYLLQNLSEDIVLTVEFEENPNPPTFYTVEFEVINEHGTLTAQVDGISINSGDLVEENKNILFTATPETGYIVKEWTLNNVVINNYTELTYLLEDLTEDIVVTVEFEENPNPPTFYTVDFEVINGHGTITAQVDGNPINSGDLVEENKDILFTATPETGYIVKEWAINGVVINNYTELTYLLEDLIEDIVVTVEFEEFVEPPVQYYVNFMVIGGNGTLSASVDDNPITSGTLVNEGKDIFFIAVPATDYRVKSWNVTGMNVNLDDYTDLTFLLENLSANVSVTVVFELIPPFYIVDFEVIGNNGNLTVSVDGNPIISGDLVEENKNILFTAEPATDYKVKEWTVEGMEVDLEDYTEPAFILESLSDDVLVTVEFEKITYSVTFNVIGGNGTISAEVDQITINSGDFVEIGKNILFTAQPNMNYIVKEWNVEGMDIELDDYTELTFLLEGLSANVTVTVEFERPILHTVTFAVIGGIGGNLKAEVDGFPINSGAYVQRGKDVLFTAEPDADYVVKNWNIDGIYINDYSELTYFIENLTANVIVMVLFEYVPPAITHFTVNFYVRGNGNISAEVDGTPITNGAHVEKGKNILFTAEPAENTVVAAWEVLSQTIEGWTESWYEYENLSRNITVVVEFKTSYSVEFEVINGNGSITAVVGGVGGDPIASGDRIESGKNILFTAAPNPGFKVKEWTITGMDVSNFKELTFLLSNLSENVLVTVEFEEDGTVPIYYTVNFNVIGENGELIAEVDENQIQSGANILRSKNILFTAIPEIGYKVKEWTVNQNVIDNYSDLEYLLEGLSQNVTITVEFEIEYYTVTIAANNNNLGTVEFIDGGDGNSILVPYGTIVTINATANDGYKFFNWTYNNNIVSTNQQYSFEVTQSVDMVANFIVDTRELLDFDTYVATKWNNTFMLNLKLLEDEGYEVTGCKWYKDGKEIYTNAAAGDTDWASYSAGPKREDQLTVGSIYTFMLITENRGNLFSTDKIITETEIALRAYPNPLQNGTILTIEGVAKGDLIEIYSQAGQRIKEKVASGFVETMTLYVPAGVYIVKTNNGELKIVINE